MIWVAILEGLFIIMAVVAFIVAIVHDVVKNKNRKGKQNGIFNGRDSNYCDGAQDSDGTGDFTKGQGDSGIDRP